jgi:hypothetical protein
MASKVAGLALLPGTAGWSPVPSALWAMDMTVDTWTFPATAAGNAGTVPACLIDGCSRSSKTIE